MLVISFEFFCLCCFLSDGQVDVPSLCDCVMSHFLLWFRSPNRHSCSSALHTAVLFLISDACSQQQWHNINGIYNVYMTSVQTDQIIIELEFPTQWRRIPSEQFHEAGTGWNNGIYWGHKAVTGCFLCVCVCVCVFVFVFVCVCVCVCVCRELWTSLTRQTC